LSRPRIARAGRRRWRRRQRGDPRRARWPLPVERLSPRRAAAGTVHRQRRDGRLGGAGAHACRARRERSAVLRATLALAAGRGGRAADRRRQAWSEGMSESTRIAVLGGGAWGTALATAMLRAGNDVLLWARDGETIAAINERRNNPRYLPGILLQPAPRATADLGEALAGAEIVLAVTPAQTLRFLLEAIAGQIGPGAPLVICAKGIERTTGRLLSEIAAELLPEAPVVVLSGPSFATDVARGLPTAVTVAARDEALAARLAGLFSSSSFRCYSSDDLIGVELGGALKNVLAIAAGAVTGAGLGASAQAAMVTRGFVELRRIGAAFGARPETL